MTLAHLAIAYAGFGATFALFIRAKIERHDRMPVVAMLALGAMFGTPVFIFSAMRAAADHFI